MKELKDLNLYSKLQSPEKRAEIVECLSEALWPDVKVEILKAKDRLGIVGTLVTYALVGAVVGLLLNVFLIYALRILGVRIDDSFVSYPNVESMLFHRPPLLFHFHNWPSIYFWLIGGAISGWIAWVYQLEDRLTPIILFCFIGVPLLFGSIIIVFAFDALYIFAQYLLSGVALFLLYFIFRKVLRKRTK